MAAQRTGYDSVDVPALPAGGAFYLGYRDGALYGGNEAKVRARFPHELIIPVTVTGAHLDAAVGDVEKGDLSIAGGGEWAARKLAAGLGTPTLYSYAANLPALKAEVARRGLTGRVRFGIASYDGKAALPADPLVVFKQYLGYPGNSPGHYDVSIARYIWPGVDPAVPAWFTRPLRLHSIGRDVLALKARLHALGAPTRMAMRIPVLGTAAERNVSYFQRKHALPVTGVVNRRTAHVLLRG